MKTRLSRTGLHGVAQGRALKFHLNSSRGFSLLELCLALVLVTVLLGVAGIAFSRYRARQQVNAALELTESTIDFARQEAKTNGYPIDSKFLADGLDQSGQDSDGKSRLVLRVLKKTTQNPKGILINQVELAPKGNPTLKSEGLGRLTDPETDTSLGIFVEWWELRSEQEEQQLACLPIDLNGELVLRQNFKAATINYRHSDYQRSLSLTTHSFTRE